MTLSNNQVAVIGVGCLLIVIFIVFVPIIPDSDNQRISILDAVQELNLSSELPINPNPPPDDVGMCIEIFQPVCGTDGQTYSNECFLSLSENVEIDHLGIC